MDAVQRSKRRREARRAGRKEAEVEREVALAHTWRPWDRWVFTRPRIALAVLVAAGVIAEISTGAVSRVASALRGWIVG